MDTVNALPSYLASIIRNILAMVAGYLVGKGVMDEATSTAIIGGVMAAIPVIWSLLQKKSATDKLQAAIDAPAGRAS
jgi:hypothetical protein